MRDLSDAELAQLLDKDIFHHICGGEWYTGS